MVVVVQRLPRRGRIWLERLARGLALALAGTAVAPVPALALSPARLADGFRRALASSVITVDETAHLHLVSHRGTELLHEVGEGTGTFRCPLTVDLSTAYTRATISFTIACSSTDTLSGRGETSYYASGAIAHFSGDVSVTRGTGRYAHDSASALKVNGTFQRSSYALALSVSGQMRA
jgi:hypothetical protein